MHCEILLTYLLFKKYMTNIFAVGKIAFKFHAIGRFPVLLVGHYILFMKEIMIHPIFLVSITVFVSSLD